MGPRDIASNSVYVGRRDQAHSHKVSIKRDQFMARMTDMLDEIQKNLYERALSFRHEHTVTIDDAGTFYDFFTPQNVDKPEIHGGFALSGWCGAEACENKIKDDLAVTIRCIPLESMGDKGTCICCGKPGEYRVVFAKAY